MISYFFILNDHTAPTCAAESAHMVIQADTSALDTPATAVVDE